MNTFFFSAEILFILMSQVLIFVDL
uniref:Uncharacterized protein n=1 Tax=Arundo donax TaxID=35708 RepID=A0A0A8YSW5_ARUDO